MTVREYIGARYVPLFMGDWDVDADYEPLSIVQYQGSSYTSRQSVPRGIEITNTQYWACTGNYNAQVEAYRQEVQTFNGRITANADAITEVSDNLAAEVETRAQADTTLQGNIDAVNDAITAEITARENADDVLQTNIDTISAKQISLPYFNIKSRLVFNASDYANRSFQSGCAFKVHSTGHVYWAQWMASDDSNLVDWLLILDATTNSLLTTIPLEIGHGQNLTYNPNTKELFVCGGSLGYFIDVSTPRNASVVRTITLPNIGDYGKPAYVAWNDANYEEFYVLKPGATDGTMIVIKTDANFAPISEYEISTSDYGHTVWQSIDVKNGILYYANSVPENIQMFDVNTGERLNVVNFPEWIQFLPVQEIEWCSVVDGIMYCAQINYYPNYVSPVLFAWDMKHGTAGKKEDYRMHTTDTSILNRMQYIRVGFSRANLLNPFDMNNTGASATVPCFKFVEDAINYCKRWNITPRLSFTDDYPNYAVIEDMRIAISSENAASIGGIAFHNCTVDITNADRLTFTGQNSPALSSATYQHAIRVEQCNFTVEGSNLWNVNLASGIDKTPSNGTFYRSFLALGSVTDMGTCVAGSCAIVIRSAGHANVVSQQNTAFLNG